MKRRPITEKDWTSPSSYLVLHTDPDYIVDRIYLNHFIRCRQYGRAVERALEMLGGQPDPWFERYPDYWIEYARKEDPDLTYQEWRER